MPALSQQGQRTRVTGVTESASPTTFIGYKSRGSESGISPVSVTSPLVGTLASSTTRPVHRSPCSLTHSRRPLAVRPPARPVRPPRGRERKGSSARQPGAERPLGAERPAARNGRRAPRGGRTNPPGRKRGLAPDPEARPQPPRPKGVGAPSARDSPAAQRSEQPGTWGRSA